MGNAKPFTFGKNKWYKLENSDTVELYVGTQTIQGNKELTWETPGESNHETETLTRFYVVDRLVVPPKIAKSRHMYAISFTGKTYCATEETLKKLNTTKDKNMNKVMHLESVIRRRRRLANQCDRR